VDDDDDAVATGTAFSSNAPQMTAAAFDARSLGLTLKSITATSSAGARFTTVSGTNIPGTSSATSSNSSKKSRGLTTGSIVGIAVGAFGGLILVSVVAGCFCLRRRRNAGVQRGGSRGAQHIVAEKEAHQLDTPCSEEDSQNPLRRGPGLAGRNESTHAVVSGGNERNSAMYYSSLGTSRAAHSAHGTPLDRSLSPYEDNAGQHEYGQHHNVVDGAGLVQQEHSNNEDDISVRSPSSVYSSDPLDELQPVPLESAREDGRPAVGGGGGGGGVGGGGASAYGPPGHGRSTTPCGVSGQYAHLVEEGMTDDEICRLEEEERVLDEAIEQAGTAARNR
jgi:hypothetical protein